MKKRLLKSKQKRNRAAPRDLEVDEIRQKLEDIRSMSNASDIDALVKALDCVRASVSPLAEERHRILYELLSAPYHVALILRKSKKKWAEFIKYEWWEDQHQKPKSKHRVIALKYVLILAMNGENRKRSSRYFCQLKGAFAQKMPADELIAAIEEAGGLANFAQRFEGNDEPDEDVETDPNIEAGADDSDDDPEDDPPASKNRAAGQTFKSAAYTASVEFSSRDGRVWTFDATPLLDDLE